MRAVGPAAGAAAHDTGNRWQLLESLDDENLLFRQTYKLSRLDAARDSWFTLLDNVPVTPSYVGGASMPDYATLRDGAVTTFGKKSARGNTTGFSGGTTFAGQADDPFFLDLRVFDLLYGGDLSEVGNDTLAGYNVNTIALQVPTNDLLGKSGDPVIGVWSTTSKERSRDKYSQYRAWATGARAGRVDAASAGADREHAGAGEIRSPPPMHYASCHGGTLSGLESSQPDSTPAD